MARKTQLELTWIGKEIRLKLEPHILLEDSERSYHSPHGLTDHDLFDNRLNFGDNLLALKALEQEFTGKITCSYISLPRGPSPSLPDRSAGVLIKTFVSI
jgi:adenine-specific DNA-methyltransferase